MAVCKVDKAVFRRLDQTQNYECTLYENNIRVGIPRDVKGVFFDDFQKELRKKHPNIQIEVLDS